MRIRDELLSLGYSNDYVDQKVASAYMNVVSILPQRKKFSDTKFGIFLFTDWVEFLINKVALYYYEKEQSKYKNFEFLGDKLNPIEIYEYNAMHGIMPNETIQNEDGSFTHKYDDITITLKSSLTGITSDDFFNGYEVRQKRLLADYLDMEEETILNMSQKEINDLVYENEFGKSSRKKLR